MLVLCIIVLELVIPKISHKHTDAENFQVKNTCSDKYILKVCEASGSHTSEKEWFLLKTCVSLPGVIIVLLRWVWVLGARQNSSPKLKAGNILSSFNSSSYFGLFTSTTMQFSGSPCASCWPLREAMEFGVLIFCQIRKEVSNFGWISEFNVVYCMLRWAVVHTQDQDQGRGLHPIKIRNCLSGIDDTLPFCLKINVSPRKRSRAFNVLINC